MFYYEELTGVMMEPKKSHGLPSATWRPKIWWCPFSLTQKA